MERNYYFFTNCENPNLAMLQFQQSPTLSNEIENFLSTHELCYTDDTYVFTGDLLTILQLQTLVEQAGYNLVELLHKPFEYDGLFLKPSLTIVTGETWLRLDFLDRNLQPLKDESKLEYILGAIRDWQFSVGNLKTDRFGYYYGIITPEHIESFLQAVCTNGCRMYCEFNEDYHEMTQNLKATFILTPSNHYMFYLVDTKQNGYVQYNYLPVEFQNKLTKLHATAGEDNLTLFEKTKSFHSDIIDYLQANGVACTYE